MDKFFILRTLAASCVSLKKKRREEHYTITATKKLCALFMNLTLKKKVTAIKCI